MGAQRLVEGNGSLEIPTASPTFGLKARGFKKIKIQPLFPPAVCVERPEGVTPVLQLLLLGAVLEEGALGGEPGWARAGLAQAPALAPPQSGAGGFGLIRTLQPPEIKHLF